MSAIYANHVAVFHSFGLTCLSLRYQVSVLSFCQTKPTRRRLNSSKLLGMNAERLSMAGTGISSLTLLMVSAWRSRRSRKLSSLMIR